MSLIARAMPACTVAVPEIRLSRYRSANFDRRNFFVFAEGKMSPV